MADSQASNQPLPDDVWLAAKMIWENTPEITYDEVIDILKPIHGDNAPKNKGSISKRKSKEKWVKKRPFDTQKKEETKEGVRAKPSRNSKETGNQNTKKTTRVSTKTNKAQNMETTPIEETLNGKLDGIIDNVVMGVKDRAAIIVKTRKRWRVVGEIADQTIALSLNIVDMANDENADPEEIQKTLVLTSALSNTLDTLTRSLKTISEVELPLCGITPEDFSQSDQERRLGALEALGDINSEETQARARLQAELNDRLQWINETASSGDFGRTPASQDDDIEDIDYVSVDDD